MVWEREGEVFLLDGWMDGWMGGWMGGGGELGIEVGICVGEVRWVLWPKPVDGVFDFISEGRGRAKERSRVLEAECNSLEIDVWIVKKPV